MPHTQLTTGSDELRAVVNEVVDALDTAEAENLGGTLTADAEGRAKIATDFFDAATVLLKIADGAFAADAATRALFADGIWNAAKLATDSVTGPKLSVAAFKTVVVASGNGVGARTATGLKVGDRVFTAVNLTDLADQSASFESTITVVDQIQQSATDLTGDKILVQVVVKS
jgi:hypothetical protein